MNPQLAAIIVHDIKNALGELESELQEMALAPQRERAEKAHRDCGLLREKLVGFLTLYKAESQGLQARIDAVSPEDFLRELLHGRVAGDDRVCIAAGTMPPLAFFDENLVALALEAALQNAQRFAHSRIELGCIKEGSTLVFTVRDDGPGPGTLGSAPSTGLGMALCGAIAAAHDKSGVTGTATLTGEAGGAVFRLCLP